MVKFGLYGKKEEVEGIKAKRSNRDMCRITSLRASLGGYAIECKKVPAPIFVHVVKIGVFFAFLGPTFHQDGVVY